MCDCEIPQIYVSKLVRTRTKHKCFECCNQIPIGEKSERVKTLYDGRFSTFYTCSDCLDVRKILIQKDLSCCHGELYEDLSASDLIWTEDEINLEASDFYGLEDVVQGDNIVIASHLPQLTLMIQGKFRVKALHN